jgi:hypothetical protein
MPYNLIMSNQTEFGTWIDTFIEAQGLDLAHMFTIYSKTTGQNVIGLDCVVEAMKGATPAEKIRMESTLETIAEQNGDIVRFFWHMAGAVVAVQDRQAGN